jgi:hypothetical protein
MIPPNSNAYDLIKSILIDNEKFKKYIQEKLPELFEQANIECSRDGKIGMEVGVARERILVAMLMHFFGTENVDVKIPTTKASLDVKLLGQCISIKTRTKVNNFKLCWTSDQISIGNYISTFQPDCDILFAKIDWGKIGYIYYIPLSVQIDVFNTLGRANYLKIPKPGTNPRGIDITDEAYRELTSHSQTLKMEILWNIKNLDINVYERWLKLWDENSEEEL